MYAIDVVSARFQGQAIERRVVQRKKSEVLAMQELRADISDVVYQPDGSYGLSIYLQNFEPQKPFFVLGPEVRAFVQIDRTWQPVPIRRTAEDSPPVQEVLAQRRPISYMLCIDLEKYDELIPGYFHVRITSDMVVSQTAEPTDDLFERTDDYYIYLKPQKLSEDEIRRRNKWKPGAIVPRWISMPAH